MNYFKLTYWCVMVALLGMVSTSCTKKETPVRFAIASKGKGKSGGARVITLTYYISKEEGMVHFLLIYDKSDADTVDVNTVLLLVKELGLDLQELQQVMPG